MLDEILISNSGSGSRLLIGRRDHPLIVNEIDREVESINTWTKDSARRILSCDDEGSLAQSITKETFSKAVNWLHLNINNLDKLEIKHD